MKKMVLILFFSLCLILSGCAKETVDDSKINIVTSFYPMYIATINITDGVDGVEVRNLTAETTGCLHDYQITTTDMIKLSHADALVINGGGMENFIEKTISLYPDLSIINASIDLLEKHEELLSDHEHEEPEEHEHEENEEHDHDHGANSHYWTSITLYIEQVNNIKDGLIRLDPENEEVYENNARAYVEKLEVLKSKMHSTLDDVDNKNIVTFHEAFDFFAEEFGLNVVAVIEREPGTYPSSRDVADIIDLIKEKDINAIFVEPQYSKSAADTIARETNAKVYTLDPAVSGKMEKDAYIEIMLQNMNVLEEAITK